ncbi:MAG: hypothetical protein ACYTG0_11965 [Planctomycetota bacterium]|jgi:MFS superfamily sulfate permease-like transporter
MDSQYLKRDVVAGVVVFLVSLPLCLGVALASDTPLFSGIIAGMAGAWFFLYCPRRGQFASLAGVDVDELRA